MVAIRSMRPAISSHFVSTARTMSVFSGYCQHGRTGAKA